ncbi:MAG: BatD family protein [Methylococcaceae bacterium]|nr:BatD family protein [Methylococcaceae bacterium]
MVFATEIKTTVDRTPVKINESFQIIFTSTQPPDGQPDFSPLEENFTILNETQQRQNSLVNGRYRRTIQWILNVMAKKTGDLSIPPISFGNDVSQPATLLITKNTTNSQNNASNQDLFLDVEVSSLTPYVQAQVIYTLRFFQRVQISQASLNEPELNDAIIEQIGEDKNYNTELSGVNYLVTERKYAIFPQKSGTRTIKPLVLTANVVSNNRPRFNGFFNSRQTTTKRVSSKEITLKVKPAPKDFSGKHWIPSEQLYLEEKWSEDIHQIKTGEPLTRTLTILAKGTMSAQLPDLHTESSDYKLKTYSDQPSLKEQKNTDGLISLREQKIVYIPSEPGDYTLPAIEIPWFNTKTQKMEIATIPETTVTVISSAQPSTNNQILSPTQLETTKPEPVAHEVDNSLWKWFSLLLACGWLATLLLNKKPPKKERVPITPEQLKLKKIVKTIKQVCKENNQIEAKNALLDWGRLKYNETNLSTIASHCEFRLSDEIIKLNKNLYSTSPLPHWEGKKLFQAFAEHNALERLNKKTDNTLEPLYRI